MDKPTLHDRFSKLAVKRGIMPGVLHDASPADFDLLLLAMRGAFSTDRDYSERDVNDTLKHWLQTAGAMIDVDHVELRRWLVDKQILSRDAYGQSYTLAAVPARLQAMHVALGDTNFATLYADANNADAQKRAARKAAWQQASQPQAS